MFMGRNCFVPPAGGEGDIPPPRHRVTTRSAPACCRCLCKLVGFQLPTNRAGLRRTNWCTGAGFRFCSIAGGEG